MYKLLCKIFGHKYKRYEYTHTNYKYYLKCSKCKTIVVKSINKQSVQ